MAKQLVASSPAAPGQRKASKLLVMSLLAGSQNRRQRAWAWAAPPHLVVANPTTLDKMLATGGLRCNEVCPRFFFFLFSFFFFECCFFEL